MKYLLKLIVATFACSLLAFGQKSSPPPPAPLIYKSPEKDSLKEFVPEDRTFQIVFPGVPKSNRLQSEGGTVTTYGLYRQGSNSIVGITEFKSDTKKDQEKIYEIIRNHLLKFPKTTIKSEKDVQIDGKSGREFSVLSDYQFHITRVLLIGNKMYELRNDVTNWHIIGDETKQEFFNETERFFNSFKLLDRK